MRGKRLCSQTPTVGNRITPADAGKTHIPSIFREIFQDHPRGCGENHGIGGATGVYSGSPPRMRGKLTRDLRAAPAVRITPADAGKTHLSGLPIRDAQDHPRGCGENLRSRALRRHRTGSPPRMRGKRRQNGKSASSPGITPADAGKTGYMQLHLRRSRDHPRGCGENLLLPPRAENKGGSPPRMRGKP